MAPAITPASIRRLEGRLERRFRTERTAVRLGRQAVELLRPADAEDLIDEEEFDRDERLPYWADLWPSSVALARWIVDATGGERDNELPVAARGARTALELGCGLGLVAIAAGIAGWAVTATDYYEDALRFARVNVWHAIGRDPAVRLVDWRDLPSDLGRFDVVLAADVLYERRYASIVAEVLARTIAPGGVGIVADPGRWAVNEFVDECGARGFTVDEIATVPFADGAIRQRIAIRAVRWGASRDDR